MALATAMETKDGKISKGGRKIKATANFDLNINSMEEFCRILLPEAKEIQHNFHFEDHGETVSIRVEASGRSYVLICKSYLDRITDQRLVMAKSAMLKFYNKDYKWGGMIGVRPTKVTRKLLGFGYDFQEIREIMANLYLLRDEKIDLLETVVKKELEYLNRDYINVYIGIPYCPTKCRYCSFASYEFRGKQGEAYGDFVETLLEEIRLTGELFAEENIQIESIYMGGGTPTTLTEEDLERVLDLVNKSFDRSRVKEFTVEAGRIDTLNSNKLEIMKAHGVDRISINPQTFNEEVLEELNRYFDAELFDGIYKEAKDMGFIINMDLIIGLPNEGTRDILKTLDKVSTYDIDNLTIHVLALKKASTLYKEGHTHEDIDYETLNNKINEICKKNDLHPYYMYRQKNSLDWGENVGYSKLGKESIFNIEMIEENQSTFGLGGGAISKRIEAIGGGRDNIERIVNPKDPIVYIKEMKNRFQKKKEVFKEWK